ncbi:MAG: DAK2 domain-containing protein [Anaerolineae bacterium]|nr:DAK2 domain-containing protein [Anaerolineae bacterium]
MGNLEDSSSYSHLDGQELRAMVGAALSWLRRHQAAINALNVFPVPDGDTGTNMTLTMTSAWQEVEPQREDSVGKIAAMIAHGALMGARGNSGVILSQIWRGFARSLDTKTRMDAGDLAEAMQQAADTAYKGVVKPVEGTILTVIRETAEEAQLAAHETQDLEMMFERMLQRARKAEARTPALLPVLRQAGVVDSGGQGLVVILEGMWRHMKGMPVVESERLAQVVDLATAVDHPHPDMTLDALHFDSNYPYDVQFIIAGYDLDVDAIRQRIEAMGDCPLVVGDSRAVKVHVHVSDPGAPISFGVLCGSLSDVVVENMQDQYQEFIAGRDAHPVMGPGIEVPVAFVQAEPQLIGVVVVAAGEGMEQVLQSLGATVVVEGGQTMNPSTADILKALDQLTTSKAIILPNNKNIIMAAEQAAEMSDLEVAVVPTRSVPQGIGALLALDQQATLDGNVAAMVRSASEVMTGEVTRAVRDVNLNGITVHQGDVIGLLDGILVSAAASFAAVVRDLIGKADIDDRELVTLYYGEGVAEGEAADLADELTAAYPSLEFEVIFGGQPHYPYLLSIE